MVLSQEIMEQSYIYRLDNITSPCTLACLMSLDLQCYNQVAAVTSA